MHKKIFFAVALVAILGAVATGPALASDKTDAFAPVQQFMDGFNKGDMKLALAACADETSIIDNFAPHEWHGAGACAKWASDFDAAVKRDGITDGKVALGKPKHVDVTVDRAYVVVPATYTYKLKGKPMKLYGQWTAALQKLPAGWRLTGWTWSDQ